MGQYIQLFHTPGCPIYISVAAHLPSHLANINFCVELLKIRVMDFWKHMSNRRYTVDLLTPSKLGIVFSPDPNLCGAVFLLCQVFFVNFFDGL